MQVTFSAGATGDWAVHRLAAVCGPALPPAEHVSVTDGSIPPPTTSIWSLRGVVSHTRYTTRQEADALAALQPGLGRTESKYAAMIPIKKSARWWSLAQDERRAIYEERSRHTSIGMEYLPRIARRLHHSRDLGEPFDFITWFEFAPEHEGAFDELLKRLRSTEEWHYVEREIEIRLVLAER